jgi:threonine dehydrogenase-like Zn-dependent dehydrogenase
MRAITVWPGVANSARLDDIPEPPLSDGAVLVRTMALGVCGTDREIISGSYGYAPPGQQRLVLGHESLGEIKAAPAGEWLGAGRSHRGHTRNGSCPNATVVFSQQDETANNSAARLPTKSAFPILSPSRVIGKRSSVACWSVIDLSTSHAREKLGAC